MLDFDYFAPRSRHLSHTTARRILVLFLVLSLTLCSAGCEAGTLSGVFGEPSSQETAHASSGNSSPENKTKTEASLRQSYEVYRAGDTSQRAFAALTQEIFLADAVSDTLTLHYHIASPEDYGISDYAVTLGSYSSQNAKDNAQEAEQFLEQLQAIPRENLTEEQKLTYDILSESLQLTVQMSAYGLYREPLAPTTGLQAQLPVLLAEYHFRREQDIQDYIKLCRDLPRYFDEILAFEQEKAAAGLFLCDTVLDQILAQCRDFCLDPKENYMLKTFEQAVSGLDWLSEEDCLAYVSENQNVILDCVIPAYEKLAQGLEALRGSGKNSGGLCHLEQGIEYYRLLVRAQTGSSRSVEELIQMTGERLFNDIRTMAQLYRTTPDLGSQLNQTFSLKEPDLILMDLQSKMREDFPALCDVSCQIKYVPECLEEHLSPAFYLVPPLDALKENCIYINRSSTNPSRLYTTLAHEGYPGHLYQTVYSASCQSDPLRSLLHFKGFTEGWATYAERQAFRYEDSFSPEMQEFLICNASATLALYALCDMNIHLNGWDLAQTSQFLHTWILDLDESAAEQIYYAVAACPASYLSYYIGAMELELLRDEAEKRLGDVFEAREFHAFILETGACSFDVLRAQMEDWMVLAAGA